MRLRARPLLSWSVVGGEEVAPIPTDKAHFGPSSGKTAGVGKQSYTPGGAHALQGQGRGGGVGGGSPPLFVGTSHSSRGISG
jgi:hypothetical protein